MRIASQTVRIERHEFDGGLVALTFADPERGNADDLPLAFMLHGLGSRKERHLDACLRLAAAGFLACAVDARFHGERWTEATAALLGDRTSFAFARTFMEAVWGTAEEVIHIAYEWGRERYGIIGHSMGGFIGLHTALQDPACGAVACVGGSVDVRPPAHITLPPELEAGIAAADPVLQAAAFWPCALLLLHGEVDETVPVAGARRLYEAAAPHYAADPSRLALDILPGVAHDFLPEMASRSVAWLERFAGATKGQSET